MVEEEKISTIEQELLNRCQNGQRTNPKKNDYSHVEGYQTAVSGHCSIVIGIDNGPSCTGLIDKFKISIKDE